MARSKATLQDKYPQAAALWHPTRNGLETPADVSAGSHKLRYWQCEKGHTWEAPIYSVAAGRGCPYCAGKLSIPGETDLATTHPLLAAEWDEERNGALSPEDVTRGSEKNVWWRCPEGHSYQAMVFSRVAGTACPYCSGKKVLAGFNDLATTDPRIAQQWYYPLNEGLSPEQVTRGSHKKVWWQCGEGHVWQAAVYARTRRLSSDCPVCAGKVKAREYRHVPPLRYAAEPRSEAAGSK